MRGPARHPFCAPPIPRWEQRPAFVGVLVSFTVPTDQIFYGASTVAVDRYGSGNLTAFDDGFIEKQIGDRLTGLVDIPDR